MKVEYKNLVRLAIATFVIGDLATTMSGFYFYPDVLKEQNMIGSVFIESYGILSLIPLKVFVFSGFYIMYKIIPRPYNSGVMIGLSLVGSFATLWNSLLILTL